MAYDIDKIKNELPNLDALLIDFLLESRVGPKHIKMDVIMRYAPKIQKCCDEHTRAVQIALKEHEDTLKDLEHKRKKKNNFFSRIRRYISYSIWKTGDF